MRKDQEVAQGGGFTSAQEPLERGVDVHPVALEEVDAKPAEKEGEDVEG
jgi:hypothetical protein